MTLGDPYPNYPKCVLFASSFTFLELLKLVLLAMVRRTSILRRRSQGVEPTP